uniref:Uncharacterized protein n=1 Tax=Amphimedon queenslandica TaxID=400682 RepID=A0A1X7TW99_AMPQE
MHDILEGALQYETKELLIHENFLLLLTIVEYVFGPVTSEDVVPYLKDLIREHENFCQLYPNASIIPKIHYIIHLPEWLLK